MTAIRYNLIIICIIIICIVLIGLSINLLVNFPTMMPFALVLIASLCPLLIYLSITFIINLRKNKKRLKVYFNLSNIRKAIDIRTVDLSYAKIYENTLKQPSLKDFPSEISYTEL